MDTQDTYQLYALLQSIIKRSVARIHLSPNLLRPIGWTQPFQLNANTVGAITPPITLGNTGSYIFQVAYTIQPNVSFNIDALEVRLYNGFGLINFETTPFFGLATHQLADPVADGTIRNTSSILLSDLDGDATLQLGYATIGGTDTVAFTITDVFFTEYAGFQNPEGVFPPISPLPTIDLTTPTEPIEAGQHYLGVSIPCNSLVFAEQQIQWSGVWLQQLRLFVPSSATTAPPFPYQVFDISGNTFPLEPGVAVSDPATGPGYAYLIPTPYPFDPASSSITLQLFAPTGTLADIPLYGYYGISHRMYTIPHSGDNPPSNSPHGCGTLYSDDYGIGAFTLSWDPDWNAQRNPIQMIGFGVSDPNQVNFDYTILEDGVVLPVVFSQVLYGQKYFYYKRLPSPPTQSSWSFTAFAPSPAMYVSMVAYVYF
jgi:hypothetical protein